MDKQQSPILSVDDFHIFYNKLHAVQGVTFQVYPGQIIGLLGPNGAGKTSIMEALMGLRRPTSGVVSVFGMDPWKKRRSINFWTGVQLQVTSLPDDETVIRFSRLFRNFYPNSVSEEEILETANLRDARNKRIGKLSIGQKQRLVLALALLNQPRLILLDEPTTGLDPTARREIWETLKALKDNQRSIVMATHMMDEAQFLCDRVLFMDKGKIIENTTPDYIAQKNSLSLVEFRATKKIQCTDILSYLTDVYGIADSSITQCKVIQPDKFQIATDKSDEVVAALGAWSHSAGWKIYDLEIKKQTLEDVYLKMFKRENQAVKEGDISAI